MYRRSKFLELLLALREEMAEEAEYDLDLFMQGLRLHKVGRLSAARITREKLPVNGKPAAKTASGRKR